MQKKKKKKKVDKLVKECTENVNEIKIARMAIFEHENKCICCVVLAVIALTISIGIGPYFAYSCWYSKKDVARDKELGVKDSFNYQAIIYLTYKWEKSNK